MSALLAGELACVVSLAGELWADPATLGAVVLFSIALARASVYLAHIAGVDIVRVILALGCRVERE